MIYNENRISSIRLGVSMSLRLLLLSLVILAAGCEAANIIDNGDFSSVVTEFSPTIYRDYLNSASLCSMANNSYAGELKVREFDAQYGDYVYVNKTYALTKALGDLTPPYRFHAAFARDEANEVLHKYISRLRVSVLDSGGGVLYSFDTGYTITNDADHGAALPCDRRYWQRVEHLIGANDVMGGTPHSMRLEIWSPMHQNSVQRLGPAQISTWHDALMVSALYFGDDACSPYNEACQSCASPCQNGGACVDGACQCLDGWSGSTCEVPACWSGCVGGGTCVSANKCTCVSPYIESYDGTACQHCGNNQVEGDEQCDGEVCCTVSCRLRPGDGQQQCRAGAHQCDVGSFCDGISPLCPDASLDTVALPCDDGNTCTYPDWCSAPDQCTAGANVQCAARPLQSVLVDDPLRVEEEADLFLDAFMSALPYPWRWQSFRYEGECGFGVSVRFAEVNYTRPVSRSFDIDGIDPPYYIHIAAIAERSYERPENIMYWFRVEFAFMNASDSVLYVLDTGYFEEDPTQTGDCNEIMTPVESVVTQEMLGDTAAKVHVTLHPWRHNHTHSIFSNDAGYTRLYMGTSCSPYNVHCNACSPKCENGGACLNGVCHCRSVYYKGVTCSEPVCSNDCSGHGQCVAPDTCVNCEGDYVLSSDGGDCQWCGDSIKSGDEPCDGGACCTKNCTLIEEGSLCRDIDPSSGCDVAEFCTGVDGACPQESLAPFGTACNSTTELGACTWPNYCAESVSNECAFGASHQSCESFPSTPMAIIPVEIGSFEDVSYNDFNNGDPEAFDTQWVRQTNAQCTPHGQYVASCDPAGTDCLPSHFATITRSLLSYEPPYYLYVEAGPLRPDLYPTMPLLVRVVATFLNASGVELYVFDSGSVRTANRAEEVSDCDRFNVRVAHRVDRDQLGDDVATSVRIVLYPFEKDDPMNECSGESCYALAYYDALWLGTGCSPLNVACESCSSIGGCKNGGVCVGDNHCVCVGEWGGADCTEFVCDSGCVGGTCVASNVCECDAPYTLNSGKDECQLCGNNVREGDELCDGDACCTETCTFKPFHAVCDDNEACTDNDRCEGTCQGTWNATRCGAQPTPPPTPAPSDAPVGCVDECNAGLGRGTCVQLPRQLLADSLVYSSAPESSYFWLWPFVRQFEFPEVKPTEVAHISDEIWEWLKASSFRVFSTSAVTSPDGGELNISVCACKLEWGGHKCALPTCRHENGCLGTLLRSMNNIDYGLVGEWDRTGECEAGAESLQESQGKCAPIRASPLVTACESCPNVKDKEAVCDDFNVTSISGLYKWELADIASAPGICAIPALAEGAGNGSFVKACNAQLIDLSTERGCDGQLGCACSNDPFEPCRKAAQLVPGVVSQSYCRQSDQRCCTIGYRGCQCAYGYRCEYGVACDEATNLCSRWASACRVDTDCGGDEVCLIREDLYSSEDGHAYREVCKLGVCMRCEAGLPGCKCNQGSTRCSISSEVAFVNSTQSGLNSKHLDAYPPELLSVKIGGELVDEVDLSTYRDTGVFDDGLGVAGDRLSLADALSGGIEVRASIPPDSSSTRLRPVTMLWRLSGAVADGIRRRSTPERTHLECTSVCVHVGVHLPSFTLPPHHLWIVDTGGLVAMRHYQPVFASDEEEETDAFAWYESNQVGIGDGVMAYDSTSKQSGVNVLSLNPSAPDVDVASLCTESALVTNGDGEIVVMMYVYGSPSFDTRVLLLEWEADCVPFVGNKSALSSYDSFYAKETDSPISCSLQSSNNANAATTTTASSTGDTSGAKKTRRRRKRQSSTDDPCPTNNNYCAELFCSACLLESVNSPACPSECLKFQYGCVDNKDVCRSGVSSCGGGQFCTPSGCASVCAAGTAASGANGECQPCEPGTYQPSVGTTSCVPCAADRYQPESAQTMCVQCSANLNATADRTTCSCDSVSPNRVYNELYVQESRVDNACPCAETFYGVSECVACPTGGNCPGGDVLTSLPGYALTEAGIVPCVPPTACTGNSQCERGYEGERCHQCVDGYFRAQLACVECPGAPAILFVLFLIAILLISIIMLVLAARYRRLWKEEASLPLTHLSLLWNFMQLIGIIFVLNIEWPPALASVFQWIQSIATFGPQALAAECVSSAFNAYSFKLLLRLLLPMIFASAMLLEMVVAQRMVSKEQWRPAFTDLLNGTLNLFFKLHVILVLASMELFDCTSVGTIGSVLDAEPSLLCYESWWFALVPASVIGMLVFVFGVPLGTGLFFYTRWRAVGRPTDEIDEEIAKRVGLITHTYQPQYFFFELVIVLRNTLLAATALFLSTVPMVQASLVIAIVVAHLTLHAYLRPRARPEANWLEAVSYCAAIVCIALSMSLAASGDSDLTFGGGIADAVSVAWAVLVLLIVFGIVIMFVAAILRHVWRQRQGYKDSNASDGTTLSNLSDGSATSLPTVSAATASASNRGSVMGGGTSQIALVYASDFGHESVHEWTEENVAQFIERVIGGDDGAALGEKARAQHINGEVFAEDFDRAEIDRLTDNTFGYTSRLLRARRAVLDAQGV